MVLYYGIIWDNVDNMVLYQNFNKWGYPKMDGLEGQPLLKWMMYPRTPIDGFTMIWILGFAAIRSHP